MSELRQDLLTGEWVIFAANRENRPYDFVKKSEPKKTDRACSFCPGNEEMTPNAVFQNGNDGEWTVRVFPNMYPAVSYTGEVTDGEGFYRCSPGDGIHEVLVDTPEHVDIIHDFKTQHIDDILNVLKERFDTIKLKDGIRYVQIFKNCGPDAGASIIHSHWQIMGIPIVPRTQQLTYIAGKEFYEKRGECIFCKMIEHEIDVQKRIIDENNYFVAFTPYASKLAYEIWIAPKNHISTYSDFDKEHINSFGEILKAILVKVKKINEGICYNICFQDMPVSGNGHEHMHWYARIVPRMGSLAGFEFATGSYINYIFPETAAEYYRKL